MAERTDCQVDGRMVGAQLFPDRKKVSAFWADFSGRVGRQGEGCEPLCKPDLWEPAPLSLQIELSSTSVVH